MANHLFPVLFYLLALGRLSCGVLVLNATPNTISPALTSDLTVDCSFTYNNQPNVTSVVSLVISKAESQNNQPGPYSEVLSVNSFAPDQINQQDGSRAVASGNIDDSTSSASLSLQWSFPSEAEAGFYRCEANVLNDSGQPVTVSATAQVNQNSPDLNTLIGVVASLQANLAQVESKLDQQEKEASEFHTAYFLKSQDFNGRYYLLSELYVGHIDLAESFCIKTGGYLVELDDDQEFQFLANWLQPMKYHPSIIVGARKEDQGDQWVFRSSGVPVTYFKWSTYTAHNPDYHCMYLYFYDGPMEMFDMDCGMGTAISFLCEVPQN